MAQPPAIICCVRLMAQSFLKSNWLIQMYVRRTLQRCSVLEGYGNLAVSRIMAAPSSSVECALVRFPNNPNFSLDNQAFFREHLCYQLSKWGVTTTHMRHGILIIHVVWRHQLGWLIISDLESNRQIQMSDRYTYNTFRMRVIGKVSIGHIQSNNERYSSFYLHFLIFGTWSRR
jgi:hypothetical protein